MNIVKILESVSPQEFIEYEKKDFKHAIKDFLNDGMDNDYHDVSCTLDDRKFKNSKERFEFYKKNHWMSKFKNMYEVFEFIDSDDGEEIANGYNFYDNIYDFLACQEIFKKKTNKRKVSK